MSLRVKLNVGRVGVLVIAVCLTISPVGARPRKSAVRYTSRLPRIDKVELQKFKPAEMSIASILATKTFEGREAAGIASLWRTQNYRFRTPDCHYPVYGIKFYYRGKQILYASVCWDCDNIDFMDPRLGFRQGFDGQSKRGTHLFKLFKRELP